MAKAYFDKAALPMSSPSREQASLDEFRRFIYDSYTETHPALGDHIRDDDVQRSWQLQVLLRGALPPGKDGPLLDFGCGDGLLLSVAEKLGYRRLSGVDSSERLIEIASQRTSAELTAGDGLAFLKSKPTSTFETITAFDVFEHFTRPELLDACREIHRILKPGGRLLIRVPNGASPFCGGVFAGDLTHERPYTLFSLAQVLAPLGFEDIQASELGPVRHGLKSTLRAILWSIMRAGAILWIAAETGVIRGHILSANIFVTARKAAR
ncbi:class I SAM-dependent methyltransferase [Methylocapsa acidiphila]|uniref:class I SAM-dependent methyltransferase n=1 Tax=Methylocapsa acidiphila TaxID=133552 RepID=UPI0003FEA18D|nr:class I SAM-dependent methyltransferase [Methylocapsa acidiphila]